MKWTNKGHEFDRIGNFFKNKKLLIYGLGELGQYVFDNIVKHNLQVDAFADRNQRYIENGYCGHRVYHVDDIYYNRNIGENYLIIVCVVEEHKDVVMRRLEQSGYINGVDFIYWSNFLNTEIEQIYAWYAANKLIISSLCLVPSTACNLRCKGCLNFSPYFKTESNITYDLQYLYNEADLIFEWCDYTPRFQVSGGEPLLYKDLDKILVYLDVKYRDKIERLEIVTNGTILPDSKLLSTLKEHNIFVYLDDYTIQNPTFKKSHNMVANLLDKNGIEWSDNKVEEWFYLDIDNTDHSCWTEKELIDFRDECGNPWNNIEDGKLYFCNFAKFASKAGLYDIDKNDYYDLTNYSENKKIEILEFTLGYSEKGYTNFCKNCSGWENLNKKRIPVAEQQYNIK